MVLSIRVKFHDFKAWKRLYFKKSDIVNWITSIKVKIKQEVYQVAEEYILETHSIKYKYYLNHIFEAIV